MYYIDFSQFHGSNFYPHMDLDTFDNETADYRVPFRATMTPDVNNKLLAKVNFKSYPRTNDSLTFSATSATPSGTFLEVALLHK